MSKVNLGRVGFVLKGDYDAKASYKKLDCVKYNLNSYGAKQDVPVGKLPTDFFRFLMVLFTSGTGIHRVETSVAIVAFIEGNCLHAYLLMRRWL